MRRLQRNERILFISAGVLLLSIILVGISIAGILNDTSPVASPKTAAIGTSVVIIIHLIVFISYLKFIQRSRHNNKNRKGEYIGIGILMIFLGLLYMDGAFGILHDNHNIFVSILWFISSFCDLIAAIMTIILYFLKPQKVDENLIN